MKTEFSLSDEETQRVDDWLKEEYAKIVQLQKGTEFENYHFYNEETGITYPYFGAIGGEVTYQFTTTSIGVKTVVKLHR